MRTNLSLVALAILTLSPTLFTGCSSNDSGTDNGAAGSAGQASAGQGGQGQAGSGGQSIGGSSGQAAGGQGGQAASGQGGQAMDGGTDGGEDGAVDAAPDVHISCPNEGDTQCDGNTVQTCSDDGSGGRDWKTTKFCAADTEECKAENGTAACVPIPTCDDQVKNQDETDVDCGGSTCETCAAGKKCVGDGDCESDACDNGVCAVCKANIGGCDGNYVQQCKQDQSGWTTLKTCNGLGGQICDAATKSCIPTPVIGNTTVTGDYYLYALFNASNSEWIANAFDVDSYVDTSTSPPTNWIFVNRGKTLDVYTVTIEDSDHDGKIDPNQHPDNPKAKGPVEKRTLKLEHSYPEAQVGQPSSSEIYAASPTLIYFGNSSGWATGDGDLYSFDLKTKVRKKVISAPSFAVDLLGRDETTGVWYASNEKTRSLYRYFPGQGWVPQFGVPFFSQNHTNDHLDGLEVVQNPNDGMVYYYFSDMISNFISQYYWDKKSKKWVQKNLFKYQDNGAGYVEGMGFGAFNHFWVTSGKTLYELGGGKLQDYVEPS